MVTDEHGASGEDDGGEIDTGCGMTAVTTIAVIAFGIRIYPPSFRESLPLRGQGGLHRWNGEVPHRVKQRFDISHTEPRPISEVKASIAVSNPM